MISIVLPTYNNARTIRKCLDGIMMQDYSDKLLEILIVDGGSTDGTLDIVRNYDVKVLRNKKRVEEYGRVVGIKKAKGDIIGFIDADNIIMNKDFLSKIIRPFEDKEISGVDTLFFSFSKKDNMVTKYCALLSGDDPFAIYLGINDRLCYFNGRWTGLEHLEEDKGDYLKVRIHPGKVPAMGSNGFFVRKNVLKKVKYEPFIHTDVANRLVNEGFDCYGKVKVGLKHDLEGVNDFFKKKIRRIKRRLSGEINLEYPYNFSRIKLLLISLAFFTCIIPIFDAVRGFLRRPSLAWLFHPIACFGVLLIYVWNTFLHYFEK